MKKFFKIFFISLGSLVLLLILTVSIALWLVFTPQRLTPIVRKEAKKYITCRYDIGQVELTFFSTFPHFGLKLDHFTLINPVPGAPNDTLINVGKFVGVIDAVEWYKYNRVLLTGLLMSDGNIHVFSDSLGHTNYDIMAADTTAAEEPSAESTFSYLNMGTVKLENINLQYVDLSEKMTAAISDLTGQLNGEMRTDSISGTVRVDHSRVSFEYDGEKYLRNAAIKMDAPLEVILSRELIRLKNASASVNDIGIAIDGSVENDTTNNNLITDLTYELKSCQIKDLLNLVPPGYQSYLEGIEIDGILASEGKIKGIYNDTRMPLMDIHLALSDGSMKYQPYPIPLHDMEGDVRFYSDLNNDKISYLRINGFKAKTPQSAFETKGLINQLYTNIHCNLITQAGLTLEEFNRFIPADLKMTLKGKASGQVKSDFTMTQLEKMQVEKMKFSGSVTLKDFHAQYDSISMHTKQSKVDFSLPNARASEKATGFVAANIESEDMAVSKIESYQALLKDAHIVLETSDVRDTTRIPDLKCSFSMASLSASMDTLSLAIACPSGDLTVAPRPDHPDQPKIRLEYNSDQITSKMGECNALDIQKIGLAADVVNDNAQKDIFLQWMVKGYVDMKEGTFSLASLKNPVEIPAVRMDFNPEKFNIDEGRVRIDKSDFSLSGTLNNILSYYRGDSILRGNFNFTSANTDINQLMSLTSGIGDSTSAKTETSADSTSYTGPYMVPKRIDFTLNTSIKKAVMGIDTISNIRGKLRVDDGILVLDDVTLSTPAANMQITAMYKTPRRNHLFLGLDYHLLDVEIGQLLTMIPEIDTLMPMLRSFSGKGEFHMAVETYLDSLYNIKKSTLLGAASIKGYNLVLMDGETFSEIAKSLRFNKKTQNKVDTLSAEFTIFRNQIDVYPFLIVMDKYKAVVAGRHDINMTFDYNISVIDSPLPFKLGVDVKGNIDNFKYTIGKCKYPDYYRPVSRKSVESKQIELRKMIRDALTRKVIQT
jgi:hypothetical protein